MIPCVNAELDGLQFSKKTGDKMRSEKQLACSQTFHEMVATVCSLAGFKNSCQKKAICKIQIPHLS